jgi:hypothetical protein
LKIFIAGCARSGTTLTLALMQCFADTFVFPDEQHFSYFAKLADRPERNLVVKRRFDSHAFLSRIPQEIGLIYCVRHPLDVLTSSHPETIAKRRFHTTPDRWLQERASLDQLRKAQPEREIFFIRYEDLVRDPDRVQERLALTFALVPTVAFSQNPHAPIFSTSLRKWETHPDYLTFLYSQPLGFLKQVTNFCEEFDYDVPTPVVA